MLAAVTDVNGNSLCGEVDETSAGVDSQIMGSMLPSGSLDGAAAA